MGNKNIKASEENRKKEFEKFKTFFMSWREKLGLRDWKISYFEYRDIKEDDTPYATVRYDLTQKMAWVYFYGSVTNRFDAEEKALHEVLHLLLAESSPEEADTKEEHGIINRLLPVLLGGER
ncbi:CRISPR/Cas system CSM-associated protein Csm2 small subunit [Elusimicrobium posterum]|uniref:hypothetical protein n=1 Tax=Elusimicrobium posterum TaxID=3116653 RepID=UPI003C7255F7